MHWSCYKNAMKSKSIAEVHLNSHNRKTENISNIIKNEWKTVTLVRDGPSDGFYGKSLVSLHSIHSCARQSKRICNVLFRSPLAHRISDRNKSDCWELTPANKVTHTHWSNRFKRSNGEEDRIQTVQSKWLWLLCSVSAKSNKYCYLFCFNIVIKLIC